MKFPKAIIICGCPGSGKSYLANELFKKQKEGIWFILDDPALNFKIEELLEQGLNLIIADPKLCDENTRNAALNTLRYFYYDIECIYFENNEEKCQKNIAYRNDGRIIGDFRAFNYTIPKNVVTLEIWQKE